MFLDIVERLEKLRAVVKEFPSEAGVYLMKSAADKIIYVGKAKNIRARVRSYFLNGDNISPKTRILVGSIHKIEYIITKTEVEAFLLEASLIKKHKPKYNIRLKDDKSYPYICVSMPDEYPRLYLRRRVQKDGALYFGPFANGYVVHETIRMLNLIFQIRDCSDHFMKARKRPCMTHQIGRCTAPCVNAITPEAYRERVLSAVQFLKGKDRKVIRELENQMLALAEEERFEEAARLRDGLKGLTAALEKQIVVNDARDVDQDVISYFGDHRGTLIETLHIRAGRVLGSRPHFIGHLDTEDAAEDPRDWLASFINQYYESNVVPDEVILPVSLGDDINKLIGAVLEERAGHKVKVRVGADHKSQKLMSMAEHNARDHFRHAVEKSDKKREGLLDIQKKFGLSKVPQRIECFDISHFQGSETVASQVVFEDGVPAKEHYRLYKIRTAGESDDYAAMLEVLSRRLKHTEYEDPDLILIDGGKGQLSTVVRVLADLKREDLPVASIAKARTVGKFEDSEVSATDERFFLPGRSNPVVFRSNSEAFRILVCLRDEAHRFAISFHRKLRENSSLQGALDNIHGVGEVLKKRLLESFVTVEALRNANVDEICQVEGVGRPLAEKILAELNQESTNA